MKRIFTLLRPRVLSMKAPGRSTDDRRKTGALVVIGMIGLLFWGGIFGVSFRALSYFKSIEGLGDILALKLLSMLLITLFSLLVFSSILTILSKLYLSRDLSLVHALPVPAHQIYTARWLESTVDSAWMVVLYTLPVFLSYGIIFGAGLPYYCVMAAVLPMLALTASAVCAIVVMIAALVVPAGRIRTVFIFVGLLLFLVLFLTFRLLRPERLVDPDVFSTTLQYLAALTPPTSALYPTTWAFDALKTTLLGTTAASMALPLGLLVGACGFMGATGILVADAVYFKGLSRSATGEKRVFRGHRFMKRRFLRVLSGPTRAFLVKEIKTFLRDQTQWTQLFLIAGLVAIYLYNFSVLPLEKAPIQTLYLQNLLAFLNMGLAAFVLTAITARFAFPAVSLEKEAIWLVFSAPIRVRTFLWIKFFIYFCPLLLLTEVLIVATNLMLQVTPFMMILSTTTLFFMVPGVVALGVGLGSVYPDYHAENPIQTVTSYGGFLFMILAGLFITIIIVLEAGPVYQLFMAGVQGRELDRFAWIGIGVSFGAAFAICVAMVIVPLTYGSRRLSA
jgi:ABC-2 type transport system permease protein